jgi:hypothetical protein
MESFFTGEPVLDVVITVILMLLVKSFLGFFAIIVVIAGLFFLIQSLPALFENLLKQWLLILFEVF